MSNELTIENFDTTLQEYQIVMVDFWASWCTPCQQILKILPRLENALEGLDVIVGKVNVDIQPELKQRYNVTKIPTFIFFQNGMEVSRKIGVVPLVELEQEIKTMYKIELNRSGYGE